MTGPRDCDAFPGAIWSPHLSVQAASRVEGSDWREHRPGIPVKTKNNKGVDGSSALCLNFLKMVLKYNMYPFYMYDSGIFY